MAHLGAPSAFCPLCRDMRAEMQDNIGFTEPLPTVHAPSPPPLNPSASTAKKRLKTALAWALGLGLLAWLLHRTPLAEVRAALLQPGVGTWALTLGGLLTSYGLRAARLQVVLDLDAHQQAPRRWPGLRTDALRVILMHNAAVNLLPMRAGELSFPWLASRELHLPVPRAVACLLWMRVQDLIVLVVLGLLLWPGVPTLARIGALLAMLLGWWASTRLMRAWFARHTDPAQDEQAGKLGHWMHKLRQALLEPAHHRPLAWILTLSNWTLKLAAGAFLLSAITGAAWPTAWAGALGGELAAVIPLQGPAGFGTYEAGVWVGIAAHLPAQSPVLGRAVTAALALHVCFLLCAVLAGVLALILSRVQAPSRRQAPPNRATANPSRAPDCQRK